MKASAASVAGATAHTCAKAGVGATHRDGAHRAQGRLHHAAPHARAHALSSLKATPRAKRRTVSRELTFLKKLRRTLVRARTSDGAGEKGGEREREIFCIAVLKKRKKLSGR